MPSASHGSSEKQGPPGRTIRSSGWVDDPNASPIHLKAQRVKKEPPIPVPRVAHPKGNAPLLSVGGEWALKECEDHTTWVNDILKQQDYRPVEDLRRGCSDGVTLVNITELLCSERPSGIHGLPVLKSHRIQNVTQCLNLLESRGVEVEGLKPEELVEGNLKSTLSLMKNIRTKFDSQPIAFSGQQSPKDNYSPQSSTPHNTTTENSRVMPGSDFFNGGLEMLPGIMGEKEQETSQHPTPGPKMSTTEMDVHGVLQHQHLSPPVSLMGGGHSPDSLNTSRSTPFRGGGHTPIGLNANQLSLPNSMTVEEKLKSLLTNNNHQGDTYDDGELLLPPPPPRDRSESIEDDVFENSAFNPDESPDMTIRSANAGKKDVKAGYVPSKPAERKYGPRGEVILDRQYRPPPPYRPRNKPPNQMPPRQPTSPGSPKNGKRPVLRDACNKMYGMPQQGGQTSHLPQRQPPPYMQPSDPNRSRRPAVPPRNIPSGTGSSPNNYGPKQQHEINNQRQPAGYHGEPPQKIYAVPKNRTQGQDISPNHNPVRGETSPNRSGMPKDFPNHDGINWDVSPNRPGMYKDVSNREGVNRDLSPSRAAMHEDAVIHDRRTQDRSPNRDGLGKVISPSKNRNEMEMENIRVQGQGQEKGNTHVSFNLDESESRNWFGDSDKRPGPSKGQENAQMRGGFEERPVDVDLVDVKVDVSGARVPREDKEGRVQERRGDSVRLQMGEVTRSDSYRLRNGNGTPYDNSENTKTEVVSQIRDVVGSDSIRVQKKEEDPLFTTSGNLTPGSDLSRTIMEDSEHIPGLSYTVGTIQERQPNTSFYDDSGKLYRSDSFRVRDAVDMVAMHNLSMELVKANDTSFDETNRKRLSASEPLRMGHNRNSTDMQHPSVFNHSGPHGDNFSHSDGQGPDHGGVYFQGKPINFRHNDGQNVLQHSGAPRSDHPHEGLYQDRFPYSRPEQRTSFDGSSSLSSDNLPKLGDPFQDAMFDDNLPNIRDFEFSGSEFSSRSVTPPLPPLSPSNTPPRTPPLLHSPRPGFGPPRTKMISPRQNTPSSRYPQGARKTPDLLSNMDNFQQEVFIDGPGVNQISITPPGSPHGKYKVWHSPYTPGRVSLPSPKQRRKKRTPKSGKKPGGHHVSFDVDGSTDDTYDNHDSSGSADPVSSPSNIGSPAHVATGGSQEISLIRKQLDGLETMYQEILKILGVERDYLPPGPDGKGKPRLKGPKRPTSKEIKHISKRFARLESHVVTLARSVAHLSSEMRAQNLIYQDLEALKQEVKMLKENRGPGNYYGANEWERFRGWVPSLTNPKRVDKLKRFFGQEPPLLRLFLKKLGYEKYATNFDIERIGMVELPYMTEQRLQSIGIPMGPRLRILQEAQLCFRQENFNIYIV